MGTKERPTASHLKSHIGYRMRIVSNAVSQSFARKLASSGVTVAEWVILREMYSNGDETSPSSVAEITGLSRGAVSKLIERLLTKELVTRKAVADDRRYQAIALTSKASKLIPKLASLADENDDTFFSVLTVKERHELTRVLVKLAEHHDLNVHPIE